MTEHWYESVRKRKLIYYDDEEFCISHVTILNGKFGSSYLVGKVLSKGLENSLSLTMVPFLIHFHCFSGRELLFFSCL